MKEWTGIAVPVACAWTLLLATLWALERGWFEMAVNAVPRLVNG